MSRDVHRIFQEHLPPAAVGYCVELFHRFDFDFRLRKSRMTKVGDFKARPGHRPVVTVNHDLLPSLFLLTYVHEVAHVQVFRERGPRAEPHGEVWKGAFRSLLAPVLTEENFPMPVFPVLVAHMANPMASTFSDTRVTAAFRALDPRQAGAIRVADLPVGSVFSLRGRLFRKGEPKRSRALCQELKSRKRYLVPLDLPVTEAQLGLFA